MSLLKKDAPNARFVIDASVALLWVFEDESSEYAEAVLKELEDHNAIAPQLWNLEVTNALMVAVRRGRLQAEEFPLLIDALNALPVFTLPTGREAAFKQLPILAQECDLTIYDAAYLYLAESFDLPLATADRKLKRAAQKRGRFFEPRHIR